MFWKCQCHNPPGPLVFCKFLIVVYEGVADDFGWLVGKVLHHVVSPCFQRMDAMYCVTGVWIDDG